MKLDLHVHAAERSACSIAPEIDLIEAAIDYGLDGLAFTDHHKLIAQDKLAKLNQEYPSFRIFGGIEIRIKGQDFLVYGIHDPILEADDWTYPELYNFVRQEEGTIVLAHPYRYKDYVNVDLDQFVPDAIEVYSTNIIDGKTEQRRSLIKSLASQAIYNSDAHDDQDVGVFYNQFEQQVTSDQDLVTAIKQGAYSCQQRLNKK
ncbi:PHP-associated domain-containing protein [Halanaerobaculum tunisiense]